jgi:hypothetical protein
MASATIVCRSAGVAVGPTVAAALWTAAAASVPFIAGALVKITYDLTLWSLFRRLKPPEEVAVAPSSRDLAMVLEPTSPSRRVHQ